MTARSDDEHQGPASFPPAAAPGRGLRRVGPYEVELVALVAGTAVLLLLLWAISGLLLLVFGSVMLAVMVRGLAGLVSRVLPLRGKPAVLVSMLLVAVVVGGFAYLLGSEIIAQARTLIERGPDILDGLGARFGVDHLYDRAEERFTHFLSQGSLIRSTAGYSMTVASALASLGLVAFGAVYFALDPALYRRGVCLLFPKRLRGEADAVLIHVGTAVKLWLAGQLISMTIVGILTTAGLWLLGVESALALGFLSGVLDFVPVVGPVAAALPAIAVAFSHGTSTALWVALLYVGVQQAEASVITPLAQRRTMDLPPALTIFTIVVFGSLFGAVGALLAAPLTAATYVAVGRIWVRDVIGDDVDLPTGGKT